MNEHVADPDLKTPAAPVSGFGHKAPARILIVSSYGRACGIAQYVEHLEAPLRAHDGWEIEIAALPVDLLRAQSSYARKASRDAIDEIARKAAASDVVNIQLEFGLLGVQPFEIWKRLATILDASRKVVITYHSAPAVNGRYSYRLREVAALIRSYRANFVFNRLLKKVRRRPEKFRHIVQTRREARNFKFMGVPEETIFHMPLAFIDASTKERMDYSAARPAIDARYGISNKKLIGCFGFLNAYKGIEVAIRALQYLPEDYHLLVAGGLHPEGIETGKVGQTYISLLIDEVAPPLTKFVNGLSGNGKGDLLMPRELGVASLGAMLQAKAGLVERVHFSGALSNDDFLATMAACDAVVLPYAEVGQTSSGPASFALDLKRPLYCSRTHCFQELDKYQPGAISFFEIGNHLELAEKIDGRDAESEKRSTARTIYADRWTVEARAQLYIDAARQLIDCAVEP